MEARSENQNQKKQEFGKIRKWNVNGNGDGKGRENGRISK